MNKADLVNHVAAKAGLTKEEAGAAIEAVLDGITDAMHKGDSVSLVGFGSFSVARRAARTARNPRTGQTIKVGASNAPKFKPYKALKVALSGSKTGGGGPGVTDAPGATGGGGPGDKEL